MCLHGHVSRKSATLFVEKVVLIVEKVVLILAKKRRHSTLQHTATHCNTLQRGTDKLNCLTLFSEKPVMIMATKRLKSIKLPMTVIMMK